MDSETGDLIKVENVLVEHTKESQHDEDYIEFFQANENGDGIIRNNKVTAKNTLQLQVGNMVRTEYGIATVTKIREDNIVEANTDGIMKMYLPIENVRLHMTRDAYRKVLQFAMECDKERYTKKINKTTMGTIHHSYRVKMQTDKEANCSVTSHKSIMYQFQRIKSYSIGGVRADDESIKAVGKGYIK